MKFQITSNKIFSLLIFIISFLTLTLVWVAQYIFDILPCRLCLYQRYPYYLLIIMALLVVILSQFGSQTIKTKLKYYILIGYGVVIFISIMLSAYHVLVEREIFLGPTTCQTMTYDNNIEKMLEKLQNTNPVSCSVPNFKLFLTFSEWNVVLSLLLFVLTIRQIIYINKRSIYY